MIQQFLKKPNTGCHSVAQQNEAEEAMPPHPETSLLRFLLLVCIKFDWRCYWLAPPEQNYWLRYCCCCICISRRLMARFL